MNEIVKHCETNVIAKQRSAECLLMASIHNDTVAMDLYDLDPEVLYLNAIGHFTRMWPEKSLAGTRTLPLGPKGKKLYAYYTWLQSIQYVWGRNPNLQSVFIDQPPALEGTRIGSWIVQHILALRATSIHEQNALRACEEPFVNSCKRLLLSWSTSLLLRHTLKSIWPLV